MIENINILIIGLLVMKHDGKQDAYSLIRLLTRRFKIYNFNEIINEAISEKIVMEIKTSIIEYYQITDDGIKKVKNNYDAIINYLHTNFPEQKEYIDVL